MSETSQPAERIAVAFARVLRGSGVDVPVGRAVTFAQALVLTGVDRSGPVYWAGRTTLIGRPEVIAEGLDMLCPSGTYLTMGLVTGGLISHLDMEKVVHKGLTIVGSGNYKAWVMPKVLDLLVRTRDKYPFDKLVSHIFKLEDINEGIRQSIEGKVIRAGVVPG